MNHSDLTMQDVLWMLKKYIVWICLVTLLCALGAWIYTANFVTPQYATSFSAIIRADDRSGVITSGDQAADMRLANFYQDFLTSDMVTNEVSEKVQVSAKQIRQGIKVSLRNGSPILWVTVAGTAPQQTYDIAKSLIEVGDRVIPELAGAGKMFILNEPFVPQKPVSPKLGANIAKSSLVGLLVSCVIVILVATLNTTICREEDLERAFQYPILGVIPSMTKDVGHRSRKKGAK